MLPWVGSSRSCTGSPFPFRPLTSTAGAHPHFPQEEVGPGKARELPQVMGANDQRGTGDPHPCPCGESFQSHTLLPHGPLAPCPLSCSIRFCIMGTDPGGKEPVRTSEGRRGHPMRTGHRPFQGTALPCHRLSCGRDSPHQGGPQIPEQEFRSETSPWKACQQELDATCVLCPQGSVAK